MTNDKVNARRPKSTGATATTKSSSSATHWPIRHRPTRRRLTCMKTWPWRSAMHRHAGTGCERSVAPRGDVPAVRSQDSAGTGRPPSPGTQKQRRTADGVHAPRLPPPSSRTTRQVSALALKCGVEVSSDLGRKRRQQPNRLPLPKRSWSEQRTGGAKLPDFSNTTPATRKCVLLLRSLA